MDYYLVYYKVGIYQLDKAKPYSPVSKKCMVCLTEKYHIIFSTKNLLNKHNELCRHENQFYLANYKDLAP